MNQIDRTIKLNYNKYNMKNKTIIISISTVLVIIFIGIVSYYIIIVNAGHLNDRHMFVKIRSVLIGTVREGEWFSPNSVQQVLHKIRVLNFHNVCAPGLVAGNKIWAGTGTGSFSGGCFFTECDCEQYICISCGDGRCGVGEDRCNCPKDCNKEP
jgi:hypothetical protein